MTVFRCTRFPTGVAHIRTPGGAVVDFVDGTAVVEDPHLAQGLREVPQVFGIVEEGEPVPAEFQPGATIDKILAWVGDDPDKARTALADETRDGGKHRPKLIAKLKTIAGG